MKIRNRFDSFGHGRYGGPARRRRPVAGRAPRRRSSPTSGSSARSSTCGRRRSRETRRSPAATPPSFDMKFHTILDHLKMTGMGSLEAQKGPWGAFTDVVYMNLGGTSTTTRDDTIDGIPVPIGVTANMGMNLKSWIWTLAGSYRVQATPESEIDLFAGARMLTHRADAYVQLQCGRRAVRRPGPRRKPHRQGKGLGCDRRRQGPRHVRFEPRMVHSVLRGHRNGRLRSHLADLRGHRVLVRLGRRDRSPTVTSTTTSSRAARSTI